MEGFSPQQVGSRKGRSGREGAGPRPGRPVPIAAEVDACWPDHSPARPADQVGVARVPAAGRARRRAPGAEAGGDRLACDWLDVVELEAGVGERVAPWPSGRRGPPGRRPRWPPCRPGSAAPRRGGPWVEAPAAADRPVAGAGPRRRGRPAPATRPPRPPPDGHWAATRSTRRRSAVDARPRRRRTARLGAGGLCQAPRQVLAEELGVSPSGETEAVHVASSAVTSRPRGRGGDDERGMNPVAERPTACHVRAAVVGREHELSWLDGHLRACVWTGGRRSSPWRARPDRQVGPRELVAGGARRRGGAQGPLRPARTRPAAPARAGGGRPSPRRPGGGGGGGARAGRGDLVGRFLTRRAGDGRRWAGAGRATAQADAGGAPGRAVRRPRRRRGPPGGRPPRGAGR